LIIFKVTRLEVKTNNTGTHCQCHKGVPQKLLSPLLYEALLLRVAKYFGVALTKRMDIFKQRGEKETSRGKLFSFSLVAS